MGLYNFDEIINRRGTKSTKWDAGKLLVEAGMAERFDENTIPAFTADMDFACPPAIIEALKKVVDRRIFGYTEPETDGAYYQAVIYWHKRRYGWTFDKSAVVYMNGTLNAMINAIETFTNEGDGIVIQKPVYAPFEMIINNSGRKVVDNHLINTNGYYTMDYEDLEKKLSSPENTMMLLCSPHNPVGRIWSEAELQKVRELCGKYNVILVSDEMHADLIRSEETFVPCAMAGGECKLITCTGINKTFNVAGLQCTNVVIEDSEMCERYQMRALCKVGPVTPNPFTLEALIAAYTQCDEWLDEVKRYIDENIEWALGFLKTHLPEVKCRKPEGTYLLWMDFSAYGTSEEVFKRLSRNANIVLDKGIKYGEDGYIRMCVPMPRSILKEVFERMYQEMGK